LTIATVVDAPRRTGTAMATSVRRAIGLSVALQARVSVYLEKTFVDGGKHFSISLGANKFDQWRKSRVDFICRINVENSRAIFVRWFLCKL
jgi:hypothetical protein